MRYICFSLHDADFAPYLKYVVELFCKICPKGTFTKTYLTDNFLNEQKEIFGNIIYEIIYLRHAMWELHAQSFDVISPLVMRDDLRQYIRDNLDMFLTDIFVKKNAGTNVYLDLYNTHLMNDPVMYLS